MLIDADMGIKDFKNVETIYTDHEVIFAQTLSGKAMIEIDEFTYAGIAEKMIEAIGVASFYSGTIDYDHDAFYSTLTTTIIVYRSTGSIPDGTGEAIEDIVPVWWEFSTADHERGEVLNDFSFSRLKAVMLGDVNYNGI